MRRIQLTFVIVILASAFQASAAEPSKATRPTGVLGGVNDFSLPTVSGETVTLLEPDNAEFTVVCFLGTECPLARIYGARLQALADEFAPGVRFVGVNSNVQDSMDDIKSYVKKHKISFAMAKDYDRAVALNMKATRTPEVIVVDRGGVVRYRGRIDDQYQPGIARKEATEHNLRDALQQLVDGKPVQNATTKPVGCLIALPRKTAPADDQSVTYCDQISRILQQHCVECHRAGEIGPFVLDNYDEVVGWGDMMVEVIDQKRMPPWHADSGHVDFVNARIMPEQDKDLIRKWVENGTPYGDAKRLPPAGTYKTGWRLSKKPDLVFEMGKDAFKVPSDGIVEYQYFVVDPGFKEDKWISASQVIPGNPSVVHHCIAFVRPPDGSDFRDFGILSGYVPGQRSTELPKGYARRVSAGSKIVFQMHYTPNGKPERDKTKIGLSLIDESEVTHEVMALIGIEQDFEIPPNEKAFTVSGDIGWFPEDGQLLSMAPHMHLRGRSFRIFANRKDGNQETLLDVPHYDFNWQHNYDLKQPIPMQSLTDIQFEATFDNSEENPTNPEPNEYVTWGDQTWQEMAVAFFTVARPYQKIAEETVAKIENKKPSPEELARHERAVKKANQFAADYVSKFDKNKDGQLSARELPTSVRMFGYFDYNRDEVISKEELVQEWFARNY